MEGPWGPVAATRLGQLAPALVRWRGAPCEAHRRIGSTNDRAKELARAGAPEGTFVWADEQTAGRGRRGRGWASPPGVGLWCSLVVRPPLKPGQWTRLVGWAALAVASTVKRFVQGPVGVKWPNDVVIGERKAAGILVEVETPPGGDLFAVVGIGLNVNHREDDFPSALRRQATSLRLAREMYGPVAASGEGALDRQTVLQDLLAELERLYEEGIPTGFAGVFDALRPYSVTLGRRVQVVGAGETFYGEAVDFTPDGMLVVLDDEGNRRIVAAGDVSIR